MKVKCENLKIDALLSPLFFSCSAVACKFYSLIEFNICDPHRNNFVYLLNLLGEDVDDA